MSEQPSHDGHDTPPDTLEHSARKISESAGEMKHDTGQMVDSADRRTGLAANRTVLAAERTYAAWVRTGLTFLAAGVGAKALLEHVLPVWLVRSTGVVMIAFSAFCFVAAVWRELHPGAAPPAPGVPRLPPLLFILLNGFLVAASLATLVAIARG